MKKSEFGDLSKFVGVLKSSGVKSFKGMGVELQFEDSLSIKDSESVVASLEEIAKSASGSNVPKYVEDILGREKEFLEVR